MRSFPDHVRATRDAFAIDAIRRQRTMTKKSLIGSKAWHLGRAFPATIHLMNLLRNGMIYKTTEAANAIEEWSGIFPEEALLPRGGVLGNAHPDHLIFPLAGWDAGAPMSIELWASFWEQMQARRDVSLPVNANLLAKCRDARVMAEAIRQNLADGNKKMPE